MKSQVKRLATTSRVRSFTGGSLKEVAFPLGGIGAGNVWLGGRGNLRDWEIFNRPAKGRALPYTFFSLWIRAEGKKPVARVLEAQLLPPYSGPFGLPTGEVSGLPRLRSAKFRGEYPFAWISFHDEKIPLKVMLEAFTPFIPHNCKDSSTPAAIFYWNLENSSRTSVEGTLAFSMLNPVGVAREGDKPGNCFADYFGGNRNEFVDEAGLLGLKMTSSKYPSDDIRFGSCAVATTHRDLIHATHWARTSWWDDIQQFWDDFSDDGLLKPLPDEGPTPEGRSDVGTVGLRFKLSRGQSIDLPFFLTWYFPNRINYWDPEPEVKGRPLKNYYSSVWLDAWDVAKYVAANLERLEGDTRKFHDAFFSSTLPGYVLDAVSSQASIMATNTCLRTEEGNFFAFEGCRDEAGCCPMNCTHVWNYEQAVAHLFPELERSMRRTDFKVNTDERGNMTFRTKLPLLHVRWKFHPAADGQMGTIMKLYREWKFSGDQRFLEEHWPQAKRALEFAWQKWDKDRDGVMEDEQHNTYDIEFFGWTTMTSSFYLGALRAGEEMARSLGDEASAKTYRELFERGKSKIERELFNGEYYVQKYDPDKAPRHQYGQGCLSDQLLGQWFAEVVGLGYLFEKKRVRAALQSIFKYNWRSDLSDHSNVQRVYALNSEKGLVLCSWPHGGRPVFPFPYCDEVWTGIEYQVASHLIFEGLVREGLSIVEAIRERHNGERRNPWNEFECGNHYARAMSSWAVLLSLSGVHWDGASKELKFTPRINQRSFQSFFSTGNCWGRIGQSQTSRSVSVKLMLDYGSETLQSLALSKPFGTPSRVTARKNDEPVEVDVADDGNRSIVRFEMPCEVQSGDLLHIQLR